jgi:hypothetical protein
MYVFPYHIRSVTDSIEVVLYSHDDLLDYIARIKWMHLECTKNMLYASFLLFAISLLQTLHYKYLFGNSLLLYQMLLNCFLSRETLVGFLP